MEVTLRNFSVGTVFLLVFGCISANASSPSISGQSPYSATAGGPAFTLTLNGTNFVSGCTVNWNGSPIAGAAFVNANQLTAPVTAALIASAGIVPVTIICGGAASTAVSFTVLAPSGQTWTQLSSAGSPPSVRGGSSAVFDPTAQQMIAYGGYGGGPLGDVWSLSSGATPQWTNVTTAGTAPAVRAGHSAVYDSANSRMTVFGGGLGSSSPCDNNVYALSNANGLSGTPTWAHLSPTGTAPVPRAYQQAVYDPGSNRMIVFGGNNCLSLGAAFYNDVWVLTNANGLGGTPAWLQLTPAGGLPAARSNFSAVYDATSNKMIVFSGAGTDNYANDVWVLSNANGLGGTPAWSQLAPAGGSIPGRAGHTAVYDSATGRMVVFGGSDLNGTALSDTWVLSQANGTGGTPTWAQLGPLGTVPRARGTHTAVFDSANNRMIVFGGLDGSNNPLNDVWNLSSAVGQSSQTITFSPLSNVALGVAAFPLTASASSALAVSFASTTPSVCTISGTGTLTAVATGTCSITASQAGNANYLAAVSVSQSFSVLPTPTISGQSPYSATAGGPAFTLTLNGTNFVSGCTVNWNGSVVAGVVFVNANRLTAPVPATQIASAGSVSVTVICGGATSTAVSFTILAPSGQTWTQLAPAGGPPSARGGSSAVFDSATQQMISYGGYGGGPLGDLWSLSPAVTPQWTSVLTSGTAPPARAGHSVIYDSANSRMTVFGGGLGSSSPCDNNVYALSNVNGLSGTPTWAHFSPTGTAPAPRAYQQAVYDPGSNRMIVFGGNNCLSLGAAFYNDVWVLTNANGLGGTPVWIQLAPAGALPAARSNFSAVYDATSNKMIVFSGAGTDNYANDVWVLSNANGFGGTPAWNQLAPAGGSIPGRAGHTAVYDSVTGRMVVFGGSDLNGTTLSDTWVLSQANGTGGTPTWAQLGPLGTVPRARGTHTGVFDSANNRMIVFGGLDSSNSPLNDVWTLSGANGQTFQTITFNPLSNATLGVAPFLVSATASSTLVVSFASATPSVCTVSGTGTVTIVAAGTCSITASQAGNANYLAAVSVSQSFSVLPAPAISAQSPYSATAGGPAFTVMVNGTNFVSGCTVNWNGSSVAGTAFVNANQLIALITTAQIASAGIVTVTVTCGGATSTAVNFTILAPSGQTWTQLAPAGGPPSARGGSSAVFDSAAQQMISYGGYGGGPLGDLWSLSPGATLQWTSVLTSGTAPPARAGHSAVYDSANSRMTVFGGGLGSSSPCDNNVYALSNANGLSGTPTWAHLSPTGAAPAPRAYQQAVYDPGSNRMIVFGGNNCLNLGAAFYNDVWVLTNANGLGGTPAWLQLAPAGSLPTARSNFSSVYDPTSNRMIVFSGAGRGLYANDVWVLSNANGLGGTPAWSQLSPAGGPIPGRAGHAAVYDAVNNRMMVFGGSDLNGTALSDTWVLSQANGTGGTPTWAQLAALGTIPRARSKHAAVFDSVNNRMIVFGGLDAADSPLNDIWTLSDANGQSVSITTTTLPGGTVGTAYPTTTISVVGGTAPYTCAVTSGTLPAGLILNAPASCAISGTPTAAATSNFSITATDSGIPALTALKSYGIAIASPASGGGSGGGGLPGGGTGSSLQFVLTPSPLIFSGAQGGLIAPQTVTITEASGITANFVPSVSVTCPVQPAPPVCNWLSVYPVQGDSTTAQNVLTVSVNTQGLSPGTYSGTLSVSGSPGNGTGSAVVMLTISPLSVGPAALNFIYTLGSGAPSAQSLLVSSLPVGVSYTAQASTTSGGNWLIVPAKSAITNGTLPVGVNVASLTAAGSYLGQIALVPASGGTVNVPVTLTMLQPLVLGPPTLSVAPLTETFALPVNSRSLNGEVTLTNTGGGTLQFTATSDCNWLTLTGTGSGSVPTGSTVALAFTVDPFGLAPQLFTCHIALQNVSSQSSLSQQVTVTLAVSSKAQSLSLSQTAMTFTAVANGPPPQPQSVTVTNPGTGPLTWTSQTQIIGSGLPPWLSATPSSGLSVGSQTGSGLSVSATAAGLPVGQYYGSVNILAPGAVNSPQTISVMLTVQAAAGQAGPNNQSIEYSRGGLILGGTAGSGVPAQQQIVLYNSSTSAASYTATSSAGWLSALPARGSLNSGMNTLTVNAALSGLAAGLQTGTIAIIFGDGTSALIQVDLLALPSVAGPVSTLCSGKTPSRLVTVFTQPIGQSVAQAGAAQLVQAQIVDDCANAVTSQNGGSAQITFSNGDAPLNLLDVGGGFWEGAWIPAGVGDSVTLQLLASSGNHGTTVLAGNVSVIVSVLPAPTNAAPQPLGIVNSASNAQTGNVVPGSYISIYGTGLASNGLPGAVTLQLGPILNGTELFIGGVPLPLSYAGPGQVNALIPQGLNLNASYELVVQRGTTQSASVPLTVVALQPGIFTRNGSGSGQGSVQIANTTLLAAPAGVGSRPVKSGQEYLTIYCTGLGPVLGTKGELPPADGSPALSPTLFQTTATVTATLGGVKVPVVFAGLTPSLVALYQVNVQVPAGAPLGDAVPLVLTATSADGTTAVSNAVTVAVQ